MSKEGHATTCFLEGFLEGSLKEVLLGRILRRSLIRVSVDRGVLRRGCVMKHALSQTTTPFAWTLATSTKFEGTS